jgi:hypothetical protein
LFLLIAEMSWGRGVHGRKLRLVLLGMAFMTYVMPAMSLASRGMESMSRYMLVPDVLIILSAMQFLSALSLEKRARWAVMAMGMALFVFSFFAWRILLMRFTAGDWVA